MDKKVVEAIFLLAGFEIKDITQIPNQYWPSEYAELRNANPWWDVETEAGIIRIGSRKRVISIEWKNTGLVFVATSDNVTKSSSNVHAYTNAKAVEYLSALKMYYKAFKKEKKK